MRIYKFNDLYNIEVNGIYKENSEWDNSEFNVNLYAKEKKILNNQMFFSLNPDHNGRIIDFTLSENHRGKGIAQFMYYCLINYLYENNIPVKKISGELTPLDLEQNGDLLNHLYSKLGFNVGKRSFNKSIGNLYTELLLQQYIQKCNQMEINRKRLEEEYYDLKRKNTYIIKHILNNKFCRFFYNLNNKHKI